MSAEDFGVTAALAVAGVVMAKISMTVPAGFETLYLVSAVSMAGGYALGVQTGHGREPNQTSRLLTLFCVVLSVIGAVGYYTAQTRYGVNGPVGVVMLTVLVIITFSPLTFLLSIARTWKTK